MEYIPPGGMAGGPRLPFPPRYIELGIALTVLAFLVMYGVLLWRICRAGKRRDVVRCPESGSRRRSRSGSRATRPGLPSSNVPNACITPAPKAASRRRPDQEVFYGTMHLKHFLQCHPEREEDIHPILDVGEEAMLTLSCEPQGPEPRLILAGGGDRLQEGMM